MPYIVMAYVVMAESCEEEGATDRCRSRASGRHMDTLHTVRSREAVAALSECTSASSCVWAPMYRILIHEKSSVGTTPLTPPLRSWVLDRAWYWMLRSRVYACVRC